MPFTSSGNWWIFSRKEKHVFFKDTASLEDIKEVYEELSKIFKDKTIVMIEKEYEEEKDYC